MKKHHTLFYALIKTVAIFILISGLSACTANKNSPPLPSDIENNECTLPFDPPSYKLSAEDEIEIKILGEDKLSGTHIIPNDGIIHFPLIGAVKLSGYTARQIEQILFAKYTAGYLIDPKITATIIKYHPFYIFGQIQHPGKYNYTANMNIRQAIELAEGPKALADEKNFKVLRGYNNENPTYFNVTIEKEIHPGDVIFVHPKDEF